MSKFRKTLTLFDDYYDMMSDRIRMEAFRSAIFEVVKKGDIVIDLGAGLGILSFYAIQAGAAKVYAIEKMRESANLAMKIAEQNGFTDRLEIIVDNSKNVNLPEKADVLISETLGSLGLEENTLEFTIDVRDRLLKKNFRMVPENVDMYIAPVKAAGPSRKMNFWREIDGVDFSAARNELQRKFTIEDISANDILSKARLFASTDLRHITQETIQKRLTFPVEKPGTLNGFGGWFTTRLTQNISINTAPGNPVTHWRQAFLPVGEAPVVSTKDTAYLDLRIGPKGDDEDATSISYNYYITQEETGSARSAQPGRNEPCPCGSGKKYKKCCGR